jgi:hypothetical protein
MAGRDQQTYGFRKDDAEGLINLLELQDRETPNRRVFGGGMRLFGFQLNAAKNNEKSVSATIYQLDGEDFGESVGTHTLYDPALWYTFVESGTKGLAIRQGGKFYAIQSPCESDAGSSSGEL